MPIDDYLQKRLIENPAFELKGQYDYLMHRTNEFVNFEREMILPKNPFQYLRLHLTSLHRPQDPHEETKGPDLYQGPVVPYEKLVNLVPELLGNRTHKRKSKSAPTV